MEKKKKIAFLFEDHFSVLVNSVTY